MAIGGGTGEGEDDADDDESVAETTAVGEVGETGRNQEDALAKSVPEE